MNSVSKTSLLWNRGWQLTPMALALALLSACGGGGGSDEPAIGSTSNSSVSNTTGNTTGSSSGSSSGSTTGSTTPDVTGPASQYLGSYVWACQNEGSTVVDTATKQPLYSRLTSTFTAIPSSATQAMAVLKYEFFADSSCVSLPKGTLTVSGTGTYVEIVGSTVIAGKTAHKAVFYSDAYFPGISAKSISVNGITYSGRPYTAGAMATKDLIQLDGKDMYGGDFSKPLDAEGFPTALLPSKDATKL